MEDLEFEMKSRIKRVKDRLFLYDKISDSKDNFTGFEFTEVVEGRPVYNYRHYEALRYYLLITCFDILGQEEAFIDFNTFLNSGRFSTERKEILKSISNPNDMESTLKEFHKQYLDKYGVSRSFKNFINNVLDEELKIRLLRSIKVEKVTGAFTSKVNHEDISKEKNKIDFIIAIRNQFTHQGHSWASGETGIFPDFRRAWIDGRLWKVFSTQFLSKKPTYHLAYSTYRWPDEPRKILQITIEKLREKYSC